MGRRREEKQGRGEKRKEKGEEGRMWVGGVRRGRGWKWVGRERGWKWVRRGRGGSGQEEKGGGSG